MKKLRLLALLFILFAVATNSASLHPWSMDDVRCDGTNDPGLGLCVGGQDTGCDAWCQGSSQCAFYGFTDVSGTCGVGNWCVCRGTPGG